MIEYIIIIFNVLKNFNHINRDPVKHLLDLNLLCHEIQILFKLK